jgi:hypothetical protein
MFGELFVSGGEVHTKDLEESFYTTINTVKTRLKIKYDNEENRVFKPGSIALQRVMCFLSTQPLTIMAGVAAFQDTADIFAAAIGAIVVFGFTLWIHTWYLSVADSWQSEKRSAKVKSVVAWAIFEVFLNGLVIMVVMATDSFGKTFWIAPLCGLLMLLMLPLFKKRTDYGLSVLGRVLGLKNFIEKVEKRKLEMMVEDDPQYFYSVLPYAYVMGVSDKWAKQFENIAVEPPSGITAAHGAPSRPYTLHPLS